MTIDNDYIADQFHLLSKLMDIHGENSFKTKSYSIAAFTIEKLPEQLPDIPPEKIFPIKGIGDAIGKKIIEIIETGELRLLQRISSQKTPPGIIEMLRIKGLGPKKIATIWKEMEIESVGELLICLQENSFLYKGFGEKTQQNVREAIEFYLKSQGSHLYRRNRTLCHAIADQHSKKHFPQTI